MKLSEEILLGSTVLSPKAGIQHSSKSNSGCALGMAAVAHGCSFVPIGHISPRDRRTVNVENIWGDWLLLVVKRPCECWLFARRMRVKDIIAHLFDRHVMKKKNWTLDQLAEWVARWEPKEADPPIPATRFDDPDMQMRQLCAEAREWQRTRDAFISVHRSKPRLPHA